MQAGDIVRLNVPENPCLHGAIGRVVEVTEWGAHVETPAAATGRFRALHSEMKRPAFPFAARRQPPSPDGALCDACGSANMRRAGSCLTCQECGTSSGCS